MAKLKEMIPEHFYDIFASSHRETYFTYLKAIYNAVKDGRYSVKGISKDICKDIINGIAVDEYDEEDIDIREFDNKYLNALVKKGWLSFNYEPSIGEDLVTFPQYSSVFIEVIFKLDEDLDKLSDASLRQIYSLILTFSTHFNRSENGHEYLLDAIDSVNQYCIRLTSLRDLVQKEFERALQESKETGEKIPESFFERYVNYNKKIKENTNGLLNTGAFKRHIGEMENLLHTCENRINDNLEYIFQEKLKSEERDVEEWEEMEKPLIRVFNDINTFKTEIANAEKLYDLVWEDIAKASERAKKRAVYINTFENEETVSRLNKLIAFLGDNPKEKTAEVYTFFANELTISNEFKIVESAGVKVNQKKAARKFEPVKSTATVKPPDESTPDLFIEKYTREEIETFEMANKKGNEVCFSKDSIKTEDDIYKLIELWFRVAGEASNIKSPITNLHLERKPVFAKVDDDTIFEFVEFSYTKEEREVS